MRGFVLTFPYPAAAEPKPPRSWFRATLNHVIELTGAMPKKRLEVRVGVYGSLEVKGAVRQVTSTAAK